MGDIWSILLVILGVFAIVAGVRLATGNKPWSDESRQPSTPPADPGAEGMYIPEAGEVSPGAPADDEPDSPTPRGG